MGSSCPFLGVSPKHSTQVDLILNLHMGSISPQYHVVFYDLSTSMSNLDHGGLLDPSHFDPLMWQDLVQSGLEHYHDPDDPPLVYPMIGLPLDRILTYGTLLDVLWQMYHAWITYGTVRRIA